MVPAHITTQLAEFEITKHLAFFAAFGALAAFTTLLLLSAAGPPLERLRSRTRPPVASPGVASRDPGSPGTGWLRSVASATLGALINALEDETKQKIRKDYNSVVIVFSRFVSDLLKLALFGGALVGAYWVAQFVPEGWPRGAFFAGEVLGLLGFFAIAYREAPDGIINLYRAWKQQRQAKRHVNQEILRMLEQLERRLPTQETQEGPE